MEMQQIRYFLAVARTLNFTKAAAECHVSQPSLSRAIRTLEHELGGALIHRQRQFPHLTELGRKVLPILQSSYEKTLEAKRVAAEQINGGGPMLRIALSPMADIPTITLDLAHAAERHRGFDVEIRRGGQDDIFNQLKTGEIDYAIADAELNADGPFEIWPLSTQTCVTMLHKDHRLADSSIVDLASLDGERILIPKGSGIAARLRQTAGHRRIELREMDAIDDVLALAASKFGLAIVPETAAPPVSLQKAAIQGVSLDCCIALFGMRGRQRSQSASAFIQAVGRRTLSAGDCAPGESRTH